MENRSLVTIANHSKERILYLLEMAREFEKKPNLPAKKLANSPAVYRILHQQPEPLHDVPDVE